MSETQDPPTKRGDTPIADAVVSATPAGNKSPSTNPVKDVSTIPGDTEAVQPDSKVDASSKPSAPMPPGKTPSKSVKMEVAVRYVLESCWLDKDGIRRVMNNGRVHSIRKLSMLDMKQWESLMKHKDADLSITDFNNIVHFQSWLIDQPSQDPMHIIQHWSSDVLKSIQDEQDAVFQATVSSIKNSKTTDSSPSTSGSTPKIPSKVIELEESNHDDEFIEVVDGCKVTADEYYDDLGEDKDDVSFDNN